MNDNEYVVDHDDVDLHHDDEMDVYKIEENDDEDDNNNDEEKRNGDTAGLMKGQEEEDKDEIKPLPVNFNVPKKYIPPKYKTEEARKLVTQITPKPKVRQEPTANEFKQIKQLSALVE